MKVFECFYTQREAVTITDNLQDMIENIMERETRGLEEDDDNETVITEVLDCVGGVQQGRLRTK